MAGYGGDNSKYYGWSRLPLLRPAVPTTSDRFIQKFDKVDKSPFLPIGNEGSASNVVIGSAFQLLGSVAASQSGNVVGEVTEIFGNSVVALAGVGTTQAGSVRVDGAASVALLGVVQTAVGTADVEGLAWTVLGDVFAAQSGYIGTGTPAAIGNANVTLSNVASVATGKIRATGSSFSALASVVPETSASAKVRGSSYALLASVTHTATAKAVASGQSVATLVGVGAVHYGAVRVAGNSSIPLSPVKSYGSGGKYATDYTSDMLFVRKREQSIFVRT